jgi:perosamine synthetase
MNTIPLFKPSYGEEELEALREPFKSGWIGLGPKTKEFEDAFKEYMKADFALGVNSATSGLHLALSMYGLEGAEVITTPMTFISTNHAILYEHGIPVFADIEPDTLNIDVKEIEKLITPKTKAIIGVDYGGHPCDWDAINKIAKEHNLLVLEDAAHACGSKYKDKPVGSFADMTVFSFHAVKNLATGEGGMVTTNNQQWAEQMRKRRWLGINKSTFDREIVGKGYSWYYEVEELGWKYHMSDIAASLGLVQLKKLEQKNLRRREIAKIYNEQFKGLSWMELPVEKDYAFSATHNYVVKLPEGSRDKFVEYLTENKIGAGVHYIPNHLYAMYKPYYRKLPVTGAVWKRIVTLPLFPDLTEDQIAYIVEKIKAFKP